MEIPEQYQKIFDLVESCGHFTATEVEEIHSNLVAAMGVIHWEDTQHLDAAFSWNNTPQGRQYWRDVSNKLYKARQ